MWAVLLGKVKPVPGPWGPRLPAAEQWGLSQPVNREVISLNDRQILKLFYFKGDYTIKDKFQIHFKAE